MGNILCYTSSRSLHFRRSRVIRTYPKHQPLKPTAYTATILCYTKPFSGDQDDGVHVACATLRASQHRLPHHTCQILIPHPLRFTTRAALPFVGPTYFIGRIVLERTHTLDMP